MVRKNSQIGITVGDEEIAFASDGETVTLKVEHLTDDIRHRALLHGLVQKCRDAAAMPKEALPDDPAKAAAVKLAAIRAVVEQISGPDGRWAKHNGDGSGQVPGLIYRAYSEWAMALAKKNKKPLTEEQIKAIYEAKSRSDQLALRQIPEIATIMERLKAESGKAAKVDASKLLGELGL